MTISHQALRKLTPLALAASALSLASCAIPPGEAWARIKEEGLFPYIADSIAHPGVMPDPAARREPTAEPTAPEPNATKAPASAIASATPTHSSAPAKVSTAPAPAPALASAPSFSNSVPATHDDKPLVAKSVPSLPGFVRSPYTNPPRLVDAKGAAPGSTMICPYTQRPFIVPNDFAGPSTSVASAPSHPAPAPSVKPAPAPAPAPHSTPPAPSVAKNEVPPQTPAGSLFNSKPQSPPPAPVAARDIPYGVPIPGRPGFVNSPFAAKHQLVDVTGLPPGMEVKCPYTGKLFRVPSPDIVEQKADKAPTIAAPENPQKK